MPTACCNWCHTFCKVSAEYNPMIHRIYCCKHCFEKDWLFMRWMSDERLTEIAKRKRDEQGD